MRHRRHLSTGLMTSQKISIVKPSSYLFVLVAIVNPITSALAQQVPDAGLLLQQQQQQAAQPPRPANSVVVETPSEVTLLPGGQQVTLRGLRFEGQSIFSEAELSAIVGPVNDQAFDLAGLKSLAQRVSVHYRTSGYPFARALVPAQSFADGILTLSVIEGRYGKVMATGDANLAPAAQAFLAALKPGEVISSGPLERTSLILDDLPGIATAPLIRPGHMMGSGDLLVAISREAAIQGELGIDNHGNRYSGTNRLRSSLQWNSPFLLGDQIVLRGLDTGGNMWLGQVGYSLPLGASGLRGQIGYSHTYYELGKDFASLNAHGTAKVANAGFTYPIVRAQRGNLNFGFSLQDKRLTDEQDATSSRNDKKSVVIPVSLQFDHRDSLGGGGVSFGTLAYSAGRLSLDAALEVQDQASQTDTRGSFQKLNLDLVRIQATSVSNLTIFGHLAAQWASKNLDSSESFILGGVNGVRAYPQGEANGDEGWLLQLEMRYQLGDFAPYVFYDVGTVRINADSERITPVVTKNTRRIAGGGLGARYQHGRWSLDSALAWRTEGGLAESDSQERNPRLWLSAGWRF